MARLKPSENANDEACNGARSALDDIQLVLQLYSYPGDYLRERPSIERMAETVEKLEEDIYGSAWPKGKRRARVLLGQPIDLKQAIGTGRPRTVAAEATAQLEKAIETLMAQEV